MKNTLFHCGYAHARTVLKWPKNYQPHHLTAFVMLLIFIIPLQAWAQLDTRDVDVRIVSDRGREFRQYPLSSSNNRVFRAYLEAQRDQNYSIQIRNNSPYRIGLVIAVDGRNIISGGRSDLRANERMYVLDPYRQATYEGWRTGQNRVNRFYFTSAGDSYAAAFGDRSAMGVIAIAVYREDRRYDESQRFSAPSGAPPKARQAPGTGFGESEWSPSRPVDFDPQSRPSARYFIKYEWRESLCRRGIINCRPEPRRWDWENRFWDDRDSGYAPSPYSR